MAGQPGRSGGHNALSLDEHRLRGSFRPDRHGHLKQPKPEPEPVATADRKRVLTGLSGDARRIASQLMDAYSGWDAASLWTLRQYVQSCARLEDLTDDGERRRETRMNLALLKALNLERTT